MAAFRSSSTGSTTTTTLPAGWQPGDLVAIVIGTNTGASVNTPTGWTASPQNAVSDPNGLCWVFYRLMQTGDTAPTITGTGLSTTFWAAGAWSGMPTSSVFIDSRQGTNSASPVSVSSSINPGTLTPLYVALVYIIGGTLTASTGWTLRAGSGGSGVNIYGDLATAGTVSPTSIATFGGSFHWMAQLLAFQAIAPPLAPTLTAPANASYQDLAAGFTFTWTYNLGVTGATQTAYALRRKISGAGSYEYWNAGTSAWQSTEIFNTSTSSSLTFGSGKWTDGNVYNWSVATQDANGTGPYASDLAVTASAPPSVIIAAPSGTTTSATPTVSWTETLQSGATQTAYRVVIESGSYGLTPGSGATAWDSGPVASSATAATPAVTLANGTTYRVFVMTTESGGQTSAWAYSTFTVTYDAPATPTVTAVWDNPTAQTVITVQGRDNLLALDDASFESSVGVWVAATNCAIAQSTAQALDGTGSLQLTSTAAGTMSAHTPQGASGYPVAANKQYHALASFRAAATARTCTVTVNWWKASGASSSIRASDTSTGVVDATGAWSANAALTVTSPADAAFASLTVTVAGATAGAEVHYVDCVALGPGAATSWSRGGLAGASTTTVIVERSDDGGLTWSTVRLGDNVLVDTAADQLVVVNDDEAAFNTTYSYRARDVGQTAGAVVSSTPSAAAVLVTGTPARGWLTLPGTPALNAPIDMLSDGDRSRPVSQGRFAALGRRDEIIVNDVRRLRTGQLVLQTLSKGDQTALDALIEAHHDTGAPLLWRALPDEPGAPSDLLYLAIINDSPFARHVQFPTPVRRVSLSYVEQVKP